ncbi:MAG: hypothetical protein R2875_16725 [Desulfobacterales bacterium]
MMQYGVNLAYMEGNDVVILQPEKLAKGLPTTPKVITNGSLKPGLADKALAMALWGSLAYRDRIYGLPAIASVCSR